MQMNSFYKPAFVVTLALTLAACTTDETETQDAGADTAAGTTSQTPGPGTPGATSDAEIAHIATTANNADIDGANLAKTKAQNAEVKSFANLMISDHTAANEKAAQIAQQAGLQPADNPISQQMMADHQRAKQDLQARNGANFDKAYIAHEIQMHQQVLNALDQTLIPNAQNTELKTLLQQVRTTVEGHLKRAQDMQTKIGQ
jgi:putative membrane protein